MKQSQQDIELGRFLSLVLRHNPQAAFIRLDEYGWADVGMLLKGCERAGKNINRETLERLVRENSKQRYSFNPEHTKIRANQGHSLPVDICPEELAPPPRLYHGTAIRFLESIRAAGITRQSRQYVHLSDNLETALQTGSRHGAPAVLVVDAAAMARDGFRFFRAENGVWLCDQVPWNYVVEKKTVYKTEKA